MISIAKMCNHVALNARKYQVKRRGGLENAAYRFRGVRQRQWGKWIAEAQEPGGPGFWLGTFDNAVDAALTYDRAAHILHGARAKVNFPEGQTPENPPPQIKPQIINLDLQLGPPGISYSPDGRRSSSSNAYVVSPRGP